MSHLKAIAVCVLWLSGCSDDVTQTLFVCVDSSELIEVPLQNDDDASPGDASSALLRDGASCSDDWDCENGFCMPSPNSFGTGYCYSLEMGGCIAVGDESPVTANCASALKTLFVCGTEWDVSLLGTCEQVGTGVVGEKYHCCDKP